MENETLGDRIRRLREARRWTQPEMGEVLNVSAKTISNWESGRNHPRNSMGALRDLFGAALDGAEYTEDDPVLAAIARSELDEWRRDDVRSRYRRHLQEQREPGRERA